MRFFSLFVGCITLLLFASCTTHTPTSPTTASGSLPRLTITSPSEHQLFSEDTPVTITLEATQLPSDAKVILVVDEKSPILLGKDLQYTQKPLQKGTHILRAYVLDGTNTSLKNPEAFVVRHFSWGEENGLYTILPEEPFFMVTTPVTGQQVPKTFPIDLLTRNFTYGPEGGFIKVIIDEKARVEKIREVTPFLLTDLTPGKHTLRFELYTWQGELIPGNWTWQNVVVTVTP